MRLLVKVLSLFGLLLFYPSFVLAHETEEMHEEPPASIDPVVAVVVVISIVVGAFLIWKFVLKKKEASRPKPS